MEHKANLLWIPFSSPYNTNQVILRNILYIHLDVHSIDGE